MTSNRESRYFVRVLLAVAFFAFLRSLAAHAGATGQPKHRGVARTVDFSGYKGGLVDKWLETRGYKFEKDAKNRKLLTLSIAADALTLEARKRMTGFLLNDSVDVDQAHTVRITWGIKKYPADVSYQNKVNNEALMLYIFFGKEKVFSGHMLIPDSPYFIGLFLCKDEQVNFPYKGRYFHAGGRFVCLGKPDPGQTVVSEFDLDRAFKSYFGKDETPNITGIGFGVDTSKAGGNGGGSAFIKRIEFLERPASAARENPVSAVPSTGHDAGTSKIDD